MKLRLMIVLLLICAGCSTAQLVIVTPKTQEITIAWEHSGLDILGNVETMSHFNIWLQRNDGDTLIIGSVSKDVLEYALIFPDTTSKYIVGVTAVDVADNHSLIHLSTDSTAAFGGWYLLFDKVPPSKTTKLGRIK